MKWRDFLKPQISNSTLRQQWHKMEQGLATGNLQCKSIAKYGWCELNWFSWSAICNTVIPYTCEICSNFQLTAILMLSRNCHFLMEFRSENRKSNAFLPSLFRYTAHNFAKVAQANIFLLLPSQSEKYSVHKLIRDVQFPYNKTLAHFENAHNFSLFLSISSTKLSFAGEIFGKLYRVAETNTGQIVRKE